MGDVTLGSLLFLLEAGRCAHVTKGYSLGLPTGALLGDDNQLVAILYFIHPVILSGVTNIQYQKGAVPFVRS